MKKFLFLLAAVAMLLVLNQCQQDEAGLLTTDNAITQADDLILDLPADLYWLADDLVRQADWPRENEATTDAVNDRGIGVMGYEREMITEGIAHYHFTVKVGAHELDKIGVHRVVKESAPNRPVKTENTLFFQHGDYKNFPGMMLPGLLSSNTPDDFGLAVFLAQNDVDVWGITQAWNLVPEETTDFEFMAEWGIQKQSDDLRRAMGIARLARYLTGSGLDKMILAGYSSGVATTTATLNTETQLPNKARHVKGFIPIDLTIKTDQQMVIDVFAGEYERTLAMLESHIYHDFSPFPLIARFTKADPDGESPVFPGFTNLQSALFLGAGPLFGEFPFHYHAGIWENDFPSGLQYVILDRWLDFMEAGSFYEPALFIHEYSALVSGLADVSYDDHLAEITVPILNLAAGGGFGESVLYGMTLLGSTDITNLIISTTGPEEVLFDFGHIDLFTAENAPELVWQPMLEWIVAHSVEDSGN